MTTAIEACEVVGVTYRQLDHWTRKGYIRPKHRQGRYNGSGFPREWSDLELDVARTIARLVEIGFMVAPAAVLARRIVVDQYEHEFELGDNFTLLLDRA